MRMGSPQCSAAFEPPVGQEWLVTSMSTKLKTASLQDSVASDLVARYIAHHLRMPWRGWELHNSLS